jgi:hypothetical protein
MIAKHKCYQKKRRGTFANASDPDRTGTRRAQNDETKPRAEIYMRKSSAAAARRVRKNTEVRLRQQGELLRTTLLGKLPMQFHRSGRLGKLAKPDLRTSEMIVFLEKFPKVSKDWPVCALDLWG